MKVSDLVSWHGKTALVLQEGMAASSGIIWHVLLDGKVMVVFEDEMTVISEG